MYAAPISRSFKLTTILGNLTDDSHGPEEALKTERAPRRNFAGKEDPVASMGRGACESTPARSLSWFASPLASHPGLRTVRHALVALRATAVQRAT